MTEPQSTNPIPVTGVASGGLGTAANLEDTQLWSLEDLREPLAVPAPVVIRTPAVAPARSVAATFKAAPERAPIVEPVRARSVAAKRGRPRTGVLAAAAIGVLAVAAMLATRDGLPGGATRGAGDAAGAFPSLPPISTAAPAATTAPDAGGGGGGHGNGGGNGNGNGHGGDKKP